MTKKLEETLGLPENKTFLASEKTKVLRENKEKENEEQEENYSIRDYRELDQIAEALPKVTGLGKKADDELDDIAEKAITAYENLVDLGMSVEPRYSGRILEVAGGMLKTGLDAKTAKLDKKIKMIELQIKKERLDRETAKDDDEPLQGQGYVVSSRNDLIERLQNLGKNKDK